MQYKDRHNPDLVDNLLLGDNLGRVRKETPQPGKMGLSVQSFKLFGITELIGQS